MQSNALAPKKMKFQAFSMEKNTTKHTLRWIKYMWSLINLSAKFNTLDIFSKINLKSHKVFKQKVYNNITTKSKTHITQPKRKPQILKTKIGKKLVHILNLVLFILINDLW